MRLAVLQMKAVAGDREANLARIEGAAREAAAGGATILVTPELAVTGYGAGDAIRELAEPASDFAARIETLADETGISLVVGFAEQGDGVVHNSTVFVDGENAPIVYRKSHLYGAYERGLFAPGPPTACTLTHRGIKLGVLICYDVEFPENVRRLAKAGVAAVLVPTALPASDHAAFIARKMVPVRAFENQVFVAYANHCGADARFAYAGLSGVAAPDGTMIAEAGEAEEALLVVDIEQSHYAESAAANSYLADLRA